MSSFALLHLPYVPQRNVFRHIDLTDLVQYASLSKRCKRMVRDLKLHFDLAVIYSRSTNGHHLRLGMNLAPETFRNVVYLEDQSKEGSPESLEVLQNFKNRLDKVGEVFSIADVACCFQEPLDLPNSFIWGLWENPTIFLSSGDNNPIKGSTFTHAQESACAYLDVSGKVEEGFKYIKGLQVDLAVSTVNLAWLDFCAILNMECKSVCIEVKDHFSNEHLNTLVKKWYRGIGLPNFRDFRMFTSATGERQVNQKLDEVLQNVASTPWVPALRETCYDNKCDEFSNGRFIKSANGKVAALYIEGGSIRFSVWCDSVVPEYNVSPNLTVPLIEKHP